jgi:hypothetical protein
MKRMKVPGLILLAVLICAVFSGAGMAQDAVTPEEVISTVREAAVYLSENGDTVLDEFNDPDGPWVYGDTYVFVMDCENDVYAAHPMSDIVGKKIADFVDAKGNRSGVEECAAGDIPEGAWVELYWHTLDSDEMVRKVNYMYRLPDSSYTLASGIYNSTLTIGELNEMVPK